MNKWILGSAGATGLLGAALALGACAGKDAASAPPATTEVEASWAFDIGDPTAVAEFAHDIFVGTVVSAGDVTIDDIPLPSSSFGVRVDDVIKGDVGESVQVTQEGGFNRKENKIYKFEGDDLLQVGKQYFFATRGAAHVVIPIAGDELIDSHAETERLTKVYENATS